MNMRLRRLKADYEKICTMFGSRGPVRIKETRGSPPEQYQIEFLVTSLQQDPISRSLRSHNCFLAEVNLTAAYPRMAPQCRMITPVFHPNIAPHAICIGDHWAAGESLPNMIVRIAEMLAYQSYNIKSPLNGEAARWVEENKGRLPTDDRDFSALLSVGEAVTRSSDAAKVGECANCGKPAGAAAMTVCLNNHLACPDCVIPCGICGGTLCLKCSLQKCSFCGVTACHGCILRCSTCQRLACAKHAQRCHICNLGNCADCVVVCSTCGKPVCVQHVRNVVVDGKKKVVCVACIPQTATGPT